MSILKDDWVRACQIYVHIQHIVIEMCRDLTYTTKNDEYILSRFNVDEMTQCHGVRCCTDQKTFMSVGIVSSHYG